MQAIRHRRRAAVLVLLPILFLAADWPRFRGPNGSGVSDQRGLPTKWTATRGVRWKTPLPGHGASSPIVLGGRIFLTYYNGYGMDQDEPGNEDALRQHVICIELKTGKIAWDIPFRPIGAVHQFQGYQALHGYASSTPTTDGSRVFWFFGRSGVGALSLAGRPLWRASVGTKTHSWGSGTSPVVFRNLLIVNASVESGSLVALAKDTGREVWRTGGMDASWNTPVLVDVPGGAKELVVSVKGRLRAFDPATGKQLWWCASFKDYVCPSAIAHDGIVYAIGARRSSAVAVRAGGRGDVTATHRLWKITKGSNVSSPVYHNGCIYWVHQDRGTAYCVDAKTGATVFEQRLKPRPGRIYASPVVADGKIYVVSRSKGVYVLAANRAFRLLAHNAPLDESIFNGSPAVIDGTLLLRSDRFLYRLGP